MKDGHRTIQTLPLPPRSAYLYPSRFPEPGMAEPDWAKMLDTMYEADRTLVYKTPIDSGYKYEMRSPLGRDVSLGPNERRKEVEYMERVGLIEEFNDEGWLRLSEFGLQVAHEREMENRQEETNNLIAGFTAALVLIAGIEAVATAPLVSPEGRTQVLIGGTAMVLLFVFVMVVDPSWFGAVRKWGKTVIHSVGSKL